MNRPTLLIAASLLVMNLAACDKPTVVNVPPPATAAVPVPGPPGPAGSTGSTGSTGATGATGDGATVVVVQPPAASAPSN